MDASSRMQFVPTAIERFIAAIGGAFVDRVPQSAEKSLEQRNVERVQEVYRAVMRCDFSAAAAAFTDNVRFEIVGDPRIPFVGQVFGRAAAEAWMRKAFGTLQEQAPELRSVVAQGNTVAVFGFERGFNRQSNLRYEVNFVQLFQFEGELIQKFQEYVDSTAFLASMLPDDRSPSISNDPAANDPAPADPPARPDSSPA